MADKIINSSDPTYSIIEEVTPGVTPVTGTRFALPVTVDQAPPTYSAAEIASNTKRPNRESNGTQRGARSLEWSVGNRLQLAGYTDLLFESGLSGEWVNNKLVASDKDKSFSVITELKSDTAAETQDANGMYYADAGFYVNSIEVNATAGEGVSVTFGMIGLSRVEGAEDNATDVSDVEPTSREFKYDDLKNVRLTGPDGEVELGVSSLSFSTAQDREIRMICGQPEGVDVGTSGSRTTTCGMTVYRKSLQINSDVTGEQQELAFEVSRGGKGYRFTIPAAMGMIVTDEMSGSSVLASLNFTASFDDVTKCGLFIERL